MRKVRLFGRGALAATLALVLLLGGCGLLPEEEAAPSPPVIHTYEKVQYTLAVVTRGDIVAREKTMFVYSPAQQQSLSFEIDGVGLKGVYVSGGETVEQGKLLAELYDGGYTDMVEAQKEQVSGLQQLLDALDRDERLDIRACDIRIAADPENEALKSARESTRARYAEQRESTRLRLAAARTKLEELEQKLEQRRLYAPFAGTVTFVRSFGADDYRSNAGETFITISDRTSLTFTAEGEKAVATFNVGDRVEMGINGSDWPSTIVAKTDNTVTLEPDERISGVDEGSYGNVWVVTEARYNVLRVPSSAMGSANGQPIVYTLVDGVRTAREVEAGFTSDGFTEIISGLEEGEQVIAK